MYAITPSTIRISEGLSRRENRMIITLRLMIERIYRALYVQNTNETIDYNITC